MCFEKKTELMVSMEEDENRTWSCIISVSVKERENPWVLLFQN